MANPKFGTHNSADYEAVTKSDSVNIRGGQPTRALYIGGAGDVAAVDLAGNTVTFAGALAGSILPIQVIRVNSTSTTATNIVALF